MYREVRNVKQVYYRSDKKVYLDTAKDRCLYRAPRAAKDKAKAYIRGSDVYVHAVNGSTQVFYIHRWSLAKKEAEQIAVVTPRAAERLIESRGYMMHSPDPREERAVETLLRYGYGLIEEF